MTLVIPACLSFLSVFFTGITMRRRAAQSQVPSGSSNLVDMPRVKPGAKKNDRGAGAKGAPGTHTRKAQWRI